MFHNILVAVDGSASGDRALEVAIEQAQASNARLTIITSVPDPSTWLVTGGTYGGAINHQTLVEEIEQEYRQLLERAVDSVPQDVSVTKRLMHGRPGDRILQQLKAGDHDLLVMGSRGRGNVGSLMLGSVSHHVLNAAPAAVLIVHAEPQDAAAPEGSQAAA